MINILTLSTGEMVTYDEDLEVFCGKIKWLGGEIELFLCPDKNSDTADYSLDIFEEILQDPQKWDTDAREYVAGYLQMHFPEYMSVDEHDLTHDDVVNFPELECICISPDRSMEFSFNDCSLIHGKQLIVCGKYGNGFDVVKIERRFDEE